MSVKVKRDKVDFICDEHLKQTHGAVLAGLRPVFQKDGSVTAGNASGINDGVRSFGFGICACGRAPRGDWDCDYNRRCKIYWRKLA